MSAALGGVMTAGSILDHVAARKVLAGELTHRRH